MLSKEECMNKLDKMAELMPLKSEYGYGCSEIDFNEMMNFVEQLIKEHFDLLEEYKDCRRELNSYYDMMCNPPLKFEEIKAGMWVWIADTKEYVKVHRKYISDFRNSSYPENTKVIKFIYPNGFCFSKRYEENRFYRMEVIENAE